MRIINVQQNTPSWHEFRTGKIGASCAPAIMGVSPYQTKLQLYQEMVGIRPKKEQNTAMKRGHELESVARDWCKAVLHLDDLEPIVVQHDTLEWCIASLDGYSPFYDMIVEIKCPNKADHFLALQGDIPVHYYPQLQHQMFVTDKKTCTYVSFNGKEGAIVICHRDNDYINKLIEEEKAFLLCLELGTEPDACVDDEIAIDDELMLNLGAQYEFITSEIESMEKERERIKKLIVDRCSHPKNRLGSLSVCKNSRKGNIDYKTIPELQGMNLEPYRKPAIEYWEISK